METATSRNRRNLIIFVIALAAGAGYFVLRRPAPSEEQRIRRSFEEARVATEEKRIRDLMRLIAEEYTDNEGNTRDRIRQIAALYLFRASNVSIRYRIRAIEVQGDRAKVSIGINAALTDSGEGTSLDLQLDMAKKDGEWKIIRASGVKISEP